MQFVTLELLTLELFELSGNRNSSKCPQCAMWFSLCLQVTINQCQIHPPNEELTGLWRVLQRFYVKQLGRRNKNEWKQHLKYNIIVQGSDMDLYCTSITDLFKKIYCKILWQYTCESWMQLQLTNFTTLPTLLKVLSFLPLCTDPMKTEWLFPANGQHKNWAASLSVTPSPTNTSQETNCRNGWDFSDNCLKSDYIQNVRA